MRKLAFTVSVALLVSGCGRDQPEEVALFCSAVPRVGIEVDWSRQRIILDDLIIELSTCSPTAKRCVDTPFVVQFESEGFLDQLPTCIGDTCFDQSEPSRGSDSPDIEYDVAVLGRNPDYSTLAFYRDGEVRAFEYNGETFRLCNWERIPNTP